MTRIGRSERIERRSPHWTPRGRHLVPATLAAVALAASPAAAADADADIGEIAKDAGMGVATVAATAVYAPAKIVVASAGFVAGGLTWIFTGGNDDAAARIFSPTARGDWVLTQPQLTGEKRIAFLGPRAGEETRGIASQPEPEQDAEPDVATGPEDDEEEAWEW